jgi:putative NADH-flavin reductase
MNQMQQGKPMKVVIFGATGTTGSAVVERALELGYNVTAFVRTPAKVTIQHPNLTIFQGDVLNPVSVEKAVQGQDAVISSLGAGLKGTIRSQGTLNIIRAMEKAGIRRFISQSSLGVGDSRSNLNFYWKYVMFGMLLRRAYADHGIQEGYIKQSDLDWTIVRPGALKEGERTGTYRHGFAPNVQDITLEISIADTADFMVQQLHDDGYLHQTPGLSY